MFTHQALRAALAAAGAAALLAVAPSGAGAAFDAAHDTQCENAGPFAAIGSSAQRDAQLAWGATVLAPDPDGPFTTGFGYATAANGGCAQFAVPGPTPTYVPSGSGAGRLAFGASQAAPGARNTAYALGGVDEPPTPAQRLLAVDGPDWTPGGADHTELHTIPLAQFAVAVDVRLPAGCTVAQTSTARRISRAALAGAFSGSASYDTWGEVLPAIAGTGCATKAFKRVVRRDDAGTTFAFKRYLADIDPTTDVSTINNTAWPNDSGATAVVRGLTAGAASQLDELNAQGTNGGIGYADLATSRRRGYDWAAASDATFWVSVERADATNASPAVNNATTATGSARGANCSTASYTDPVTGLLPSTTESWRTVRGTTTGSGYAICALTYALAWEEPSHANVGIPAGQPSITQDQARGVRDLLSFAITPGGGQSQLAAAGYQALPTAVRTRSATGVGLLGY